MPVVVSSSSSLDESATISGNPKASLSIFDYLDFREFAKDRVEWLRQQDKSFSFRIFCRESGFKSRSILNGIISGKSGLSRLGAAKVAKGLRLNIAESEFFMSLVKFNLTTEQAEKARCLEALQNQKRFMKVVRLEQPQLQYYKKWYYPVLRELLNVSPSTIEQIHSKLRFPLELSEIKIALQDLIALELCEESNGWYFVKNQTIVTSLEVSSSDLTNFQGEMIDKALNALRTLSPDQRDVRSVTMSLDSSSLPELKEFLQSVLIQAVQKFEERAQKKNLVIQLNIQAFPLSKIF